MCVQPISSKFTVTDCLEQGPARLPSSWPRCSTPPREPITFASSKLKLGGLEIDVISLFDLLQSICCQRQYQLTITINLPELTGKL